MLLNNLSQHKTFRLVAKAALALMLLLVVLAPIQAVLGTPVAAVAHAQQAAAPGTDDGFCSGSAFTASTCLSSVVYLFAVYLPTNFAYAAGYLFNFALQLGLNSGAYALDFLSQGWAIVRDIANLSFIFILIYIAYTIIVQAETSGTMRTLAWVIVMALLINFSFFMTRVVIDAGNILAVQFYNALPISDSMPSPLPGSTANVKNLTSGVMNAVQIQGILSDQSFQAFTNPASGASGTYVFLKNLGVLVLVFVAVGILLSILGFVFLVVGIKLIVRIIILWLAIIASPLAFAAHALPGNKQIMGYYKLWEKHLIESSFYPAVFLFIFFIFTLFMNELALQTAGGKGIVPSIFAAANLAAKNNPNAGVVTGVITIIANVSIRIGLITVILFYAMKFSDSFSEEGSGAARSIISWGGKAVTGATSRAARASIATTAFAGRNTVGRGANALARSDWLESFAAKSVWGRPLKAVAEAGARGTYDVRGVPGLTSTLQSVNKIPGAKNLGVNVNLGTAGKDNFIKQTERRAKNVEARGKELKPDATDIRNAQEAYEKNYEGGRQGYMRKIAELEDAKKYAESAAGKQEIEELERQRKQAADAAKSHATAGNKELSAQASAVAQEAADKIKNIKEASKKAGKEMKDMQEAGKNEAEKKGKAYILAMADRIGGRNLYNFGTPSRGSLEGAAKLRTLAAGKSKKDKLAEAAAEYEKEQHAAEHVEGEGDGTDPHGGGTNPPGTPPRGPTGGDGGGTGHGPVNTPTHTPAATVHAPAPAGGHDDHHASSDLHPVLERVAKRLEENTEQLRQSNELRVAGSPKNNSRTSNETDTKKTLDVLRETLGNQNSNTAQRVVGRQNDGRGVRQTPTGVVLQQVNPVNHTPQPTANTYTPPPQQPRVVSQNQTPVSTGSKPAITERGEEFLKIMDDPRGTLPDSIVNNLGHIARENGHRVNPSDSDPLGTLAEHLRKKKAG